MSITSNTNISDAMDVTNTPIRVHSPDGEDAHLSPLQAASTSIATQSTMSDQSAGGTAVLTISPLAIATGRQTLPQPTASLTVPIQPMPLTSEERVSSSTSATMSIDPNLVPSLSSSSLSTSSFVSSSTTTLQDTKTITEQIKTELTLELFKLTHFRAAGYMAVLNHLLTFSQLLLTALPQEMQLELTDWLAANCTTLQHANAITVLTNVNRADLSGFITFNQKLGVLFANLSQLFISCQALIASANCNDLFAALEIVIKQFEILKEKTFEWLVVDLLDSANSPSSAIATSNLEAFLCTTDLQIYHSQNSDQNKKYVIPIMLKIANRALQRYRCSPADTNLKARVLYYADCLQSLDPKSANGYLISIQACAYSVSSAYEANCNKEKTTKLLNELYDAISLAQTKIEDSNWQSQGGNEILGALLCYYDYRRSPVESGYQQFLNRIDKIPKLDCCAATTRALKAIALFTHSLQIKNKKERSKESSSALQEFKQLQSTWDEKSNAFATLFGIDGYITLCSQKIPVNLAPPPPSLPALSGEVLDNSDTLLPKISTPRRSREQTSSPTQTASHSSSSSSSSASSNSTASQSNASFWSASSSSEADPAKANGRKRKRAKTSQDLPTLLPSSAASPSQNLLATTPPEMPQSTSTQSQLVLAPSTLQTAQTT